MIGHALIAAAFWAAILVLAIANGIVRDKIYKARIGDAWSHAISSLILAAAILGMSLVMLVAADYPRDPDVLWTTGGGWLLATLAFECLFFHYVMKVPWSQIFADYNVFRGRLWLLVLLATLTGPRLAGCVLGDLT